MATESAVPPSDRIARSFKELTESAARLNEASDELAKAVAPVDAALKKLNLGIVVWHRYAGDHDEHSGDYWSHRIGYAKIDGKWGLAISTAAGNALYEDEADVEEWLFNDAPRALRIEAIDYIPELLDSLVMEANKLATDLLTKTQKAHQLAKTIATPPARPQGQR
jgi:hypothetical protein